MGMGDCRREFRPVRINLDTNAFHSGFRLRHTVVWIAGRFVPASGRSVLRVCRLSRRRPTAL